MKSLYTLLFFLTLSAIGMSAIASSNSDYMEASGSTIFRARTTGGFMEYEFFPGGKLVAYDYFTDGTDSGPDEADVTFSPKFRISSLRWEINGNIIKIYRGNRLSKGEISSDERYVYFHEMAWEKVKKLEFFDELSKFCSAPAEVGQPLVIVRLR